MLAQTLWGSLPEAAGRDQEPFPQVPLIMDLRMWSPGRELQLWPTAPEHSSRDTCGAVATSALPPREVPLAYELEALNGPPSCLPKAKAMAARLSLGSQGAAVVYAKSMTFLLPHLP